MAYIILAPGEEFEHYHREASETSVVAGTVECAVAGQVRHLREGETVTIPANTSHVLRNVGPTDARLGCIHGPPS